MLTDKNKTTYCPAHHNQVTFAPSQGYVQSCCKSATVPISNIDELQKRKEDSLNGIRNSACDYCWKTEDAGNESFRHFQIQQEILHPTKRALTMVLGNLCNFQCTYCSAKYSSKWQTDDINNGRIDMKFDTDVYYNSECENKDSQVYIDFFNETKPTMLTVSGGEPLMGTVFYDILTQCDMTDVKRICASTNLNYPNNKILNKLLEFSEGRHIMINASLDTVDANIQEYLRFGFSMETFQNNVRYLLDNTDVWLTFNTLVTAQSVFGLYNLYEYVYNLKSKYPKIGWFISNCEVPRKHTFDVLTDVERSFAIKIVQKVLNKLDMSDATMANKVDREIGNINTVMAALKSSTYNKELRKDQQHFFAQFNERKGISSPNELKFLIGDDL